MAGTSAEKRAKTGKKARKKAVEAVLAAEKAVVNTAKAPVDPEDFVAALRVGPDFRLSEVDPSSTPAFPAKKAAADLLMRQSTDEIAGLQERLYAAGRDGDGASVLLIVQGMDTSGKGGIMRHVVGLFDPQGVRVTAFKQPTAEERRHPFLWRIRRALPGPGLIGVFDRSHYEDVLVVRVEELVPAATWRRRYSQIRTFENGLADRGVRVVKVMLHIGPKEQKQRLAQRIERPDKRWKYNPGDIDAREKWAAYQEAYEEALVRTSTDEAPWYVVPADRKWYARLAVQQLVLHALREIDPQWPAAEFDVETERERLAAS